MRGGIEGELSGGKECRDARGESVALESDNRDELLEEVGKIIEE